MKEAQDEISAKNYERAALRLERCVKLQPSAYPCYRMAGSTYARISARDGSTSDMAKAKKYYERYLEVAPAGDEYVPKVKAILQAAAGQ
jgi:tetratricopeptide (TPR) repeat protein